MKISVLIACIACFIGGATLPIDPRFETFLFFVVYNLCVILYSVVVRTKNIVLPILMGGGGVALFISGRSLSRPIESLVIGIGGVLLIVAALASNRLSNNHRSLS